MSAKPRDNTAQLIYDIAAGGKLADKSLRQFFDRYEVKLLRLFIYKGAPKSVAADLVQETFIKVVAKAKSFIGEDQLTEFGERTNAAVGWVKTIANNTYIDWARKQSTHKEQVLCFDLSEEAWEHVMESTAAPTPTSEVELEQFDECVANALKSFREAHPDDEKAIRLFELEGLSTTELAETMDKKPGAMRQFLSAARKKARKFFEVCQELAN